MRRLVACVAAVATLAGAAAVIAAPRAAKGTTRKAMCAAGRPLGEDVRCRWAAVSRLDGRWGRTIHRYRGSGGKRLQRTSWLRRGNVRSQRWTTRIAYVTPPGPTLPPCGKVPERVLREFHGDRACTRARRNL